MKMIQTFWAGKRSNPEAGFYGWLRPEYHLISWVLSSHLLRRHYADLELYTDRAGKALFIDELELPYTKVHAGLDQLNTYDPDLWALAKIHTYSQQQEPFLHIDGDVFIWKGFGKRLLESGLITQNLENGGADYAAILAGLKGHLKFLPEAILKDKNTSVFTYNAGIFGGHDLEFIRDYCAQAFDFVAQNTGTLEEVNKTSFNIFFEQYLYYRLTIEENKDVDCLFPGTFPDAHYLGFGSFEEVPGSRTYLHLVSKYKKNKQVLSMMERQLRLEFPEAYLKLSRFFEKTEGLEMPTGTKADQFESFLKDPNSAAATFLRTDTAQFEALNHFVNDGLLAHFDSKLFANPSITVSAKPDEADSVQVQHSHFDYRATVPLMSGNVAEVELDSLDYEIIGRVQSSPLTIAALLQYLVPYFHNESFESLSDDFVRLMMERLKGLLSNRIILLQREDKLFNTNQQNFGKFSNRLSEENRHAGGKILLS